MTESSTQIPGKKQKDWGKWALFTLFLCGYAWSYTYLATILIEEANTSRIGNIQTQYIDAVYKAAAIGEDDPAASRSISYRFTQLLPQYTDGLIDPLWPWLMRDHSQEAPDEMFETGKQINMVLSVSLLILFGLGAAKAFSFTGSAAMILMGGFGVILERSAYFSSDAIYYLLVVMAWLCALSMIRQNMLWQYAVFGLLLGLAYLAKAMIWPIAVGFIIVSIIRSIACAVAARRKGEAEDSLWVPSNQLVGFAMMLTAFLLIVGPRMSYANTQFGEPFYTLQNYVVWMDSPAEAAEFRRSYPGREELETLNIMTRPGIVRYVSENGFSKLFQRGWNGAIYQLKFSVLGRGGWILIYGMGVFVVIGSIHRWAFWKREHEIWRVRGTSAPWMLLFLLLVLTITLFYAGIGNPVVRFNSMTTAMFLPVLLTFFWISERYRRQLQRSRCARVVNWVHFSLMLLPILFQSYKIVRAIQSPIAS